MSKPSIAFFGSSIVSAYWNGAATYYRGIIKYLFKLGYQVTFFEPDAYERQQHRDLPDPFWCQVVVYPNSMRGVEQALDQARSADILIKASGVGVFDEFLELAVPAMRRSGQTIIFWDVDAPATLERIKKNPEDIFRKLIPRYDYILTYGGGLPVVNAYKNMNAGECIPVYNALDPDTHFPVIPEERFMADLSFIGNRLPDREARVKDFFLNVAEKMPEKTFILGGNGWEDLPLSSNLKYMSHIFTRDHNAFNCSPLAVLNISRQSMADYGFSPATRIFEAAGAGACIITDLWEGIDQFFEPDKEILVAEDGRDVFDFMKMLDKPKARQIGQAARKAVLIKHTYKQRALQVDQILTSKIVFQKEFIN
ncbi:MAG: glycosyltransferase [Syntrophothermus sp.]